jgi:diadenosine tetraphosphate (Ap4A) HIT family hydrolase
MESLPRGIVLAMEGCFACDLTNGRLPLPGGTIHRESGWVVEHCLGPLGVGTLIVKPERHVVHVADLTDAEAEAMGPLLHRTARVVTELCDPDQVYISLWSHAGGEAGHIHHVVQPVDTDATARRGAYGPKLQMAMFEHDEPPATDAVEEVAERARQVWNSLEQKGLSR